MSVSLRKCAEALGVTHPTLINKRNAGLCSPEPDGKWDIEKTRGALAESASRQVPKAPKKTGKATAETGTGTDYWQARARREDAEADRSRLKLQSELGDVLPTVDVRKAYQAIGRVVAGPRSQLPAQLAAKVVGKTDVREIEKIIRAVMKAADERISKEIERKFGKLAEGAQAA